MVLHKPVFIGWKTPLAGGVAAQLIAVGRQARRPEELVLPIDLGSHRVIVPSQFAARLVKEQLAILSHNRGISNNGDTQVRSPADTSGVLLPVFETPAEFLNWGNAHDKVASSSDELMAWIEVLASTNRSTLSSLFPNAEEGSFSFEEAKRFAQTLCQLRDELGGSASGHDFKAVASLPDNKEPLRWRDLATLEEGYRDILVRRGLEDRNDLRTARAKGPSLPEGVTHIWLAGLPDPQPLLVTALGRMAEFFEIRAVVGAHESEAANFDNWGRPLADNWQDRQSDWKNFARCVHVVGGPTEALNKLRLLLGSNKPDASLHAVCACDREVDAPKIAALIHSLGADALNPLGLPHDANALHHGLRVWSQFLGRREPDFAIVREALLIPALVQAITGESSADGFSTVNECLDTADRALVRGTLEEVRAHISSLPPAGEGFRQQRENKALLSVAVYLQDLQLLRRKHLQLTWQEALIETIRMLLGGRKLRNDNLSDAFLIEVADHLGAAAAKIDRANSEWSLKLGHDELFAITLHTAATKRFRRSDADEAINLPGWVEAPWDPAPHLVLFGLSDHLVPRVTHAHPFLPAAIRELVGLPSNPSTFAAAAFTLEQLWRRREEGGWLDIVVPQQDADGNPLKPSRLLFLGPDDALTDRVKLLFGGTLANEAQPYWEIPTEHRLVPLAEPAKAKQVVRSISATAFKAYLEDPAEFWLKYALGLNKTEHGRIELDSAGFGTLVHGALERFGREYRGQSITDLGSIKDALKRHLNDTVRENLGGKPAVALQVQARSALERLLAFAQIQKKLFDEGWVIDEVESALPTLTIDGVEIKGRFDRLDRHSDGRRWRVYDYKTFAKAESPLSRHVRPAKTSEEFTAIVHKRGRKQEINGEKLIRWTDLQLPVYHMALLPSLPARHGSAAPLQGGSVCLEIGYICLPALAGETTEDIWPYYEDDYRAEAEQAVRKVLKKLLKGGAESFQPSSRGSPYPLLAALATRPMSGYLNIDQLGGTLK